MHLKTLTVTGFKSFADRTRIECEPGVTVIVGPNGSGKSNLVDAVAWAMGTQATTALRTQRMEDVIFAGTAVRPALGRAEVSLTFDNGDGALALDMGEVTITRRLYRDGTSEYHVNGTPARLLDIQELLADSGVGRHQHVIVGQGRIDDVLSAGPDDHRAVIEEAAGVIKHRRRRERSLRRLEATDLDIERARELLDQERRRLRPLKRQANAAARHAGVRGEWRALRLWLGGDLLRSVRRRRVALAEAEEVASRRLGEATAERTELSESLADMQRAAGEVGGALERDREAAARLETTAERLHSIALLARERRIGVERRLRGESERRRSLGEEQAAVERQIAAAVADEQAALEAAEEAAALVRSLEDEERSLAEADRLTSEGVVASFRGDLSALEAAAARDERERLALTRRRGAVAALIDEERAEVARLSQEEAEAGGAREAAFAALEEKRLAAARDAEEATAAEERWRAAEASSAAALARVDALESSASLADAETRSKAVAMEPVLGAVLELLDVPPRLVAAVTAALGPWADSFLVTDHDGVVAAATEFKAEGPGRAGFVSAQSDAGVAAREAARGTGAEALVDALGDEADGPLAATLLGDVVLVEAWEEALRILMSRPGVRAVTADGDLITAEGIATGAVAASAGDAIEQARADAERVATELARARSRHATARREAAAAAEAERVASLKLLEEERRHGGITQALQLLDRSSAELQAEMDRLDARMRSLAKEAATREERMGELRARVAELEADGPSDEAPALEEVARRRVEVGRALGEARAGREEAAAAAAACAERRSMLRARLDELQSQGDAGSAATDVVIRDELEDVEAWARRAGDLVQGHITSLRERERSLRSQVGAVGDRLDAARERRDALTGEIERLREELSELAVEATELRVREEAVAEGLRRDVDASEEEALSAARPEVPEGVDPEAHLESLAASLRRMGPVNPLAADEYRELAEKVEFMEEQLADLERSRAELRKVIRALDEEIARLFMEAFADISARFTESFGLLFPGGTGRLTLTEPGDPLTTGVEIHAQPMGKKVGRLTLLSGGERSLAALAFLFAVFRARPSPFYVLDEVEAALDDANLRRFIRLVATLRDEAQVVIVTHQQQTMEAADILYGVTMEPGDTSRVIAKRLAAV